MKLMMSNLEDFIKEMKNRQITTVRSACLIKNTPLRDTNLTTEIAKLSVLTLDNSRTEIPIIIEFELEIYKDLSSLFFNSEEYKKAHIEKISKIMEVLKKEKIDIKNGYYEE